MILDSSAVPAFLQDEPGADRLLTAAASATCRISVATWLEAGIVTDARSATHGEILDGLLTTLDATIEPVTPHQGHLARMAYRRYGRGSGSPARLTYGDCFAYALSVATGEPLLFVGDDSRHTDVPPALTA